MRSSRNDAERAMLGMARRIARRFDMVPIRRMTDRSAMVEIRVDQCDAISPKETDQANNCQPARYPGLNHGEQDSRPTLYPQCIYNLALPMQARIAKWGNRLA